MIEEREIVTILHDFQKRGASADKLGWVMQHLQNGSGDLSQETTEKIQAILLKTYKEERNLSREVREWVLSTNGNFLSTEVAKCLHLSTRNEEKNLSIILVRLAAEGIIEKVGNKNGSYRRVEADVEEVDVEEVDGEAIDLQLPLSLRLLWVPQKKNVIIVAGCPDSGKTAFLLNLVRMNLGKFPISYFNSDMGASELRDRLRKFGEPMPIWKQARFYERDGNFADVIRPNDLNVIDYMEILSDFYLVGQWIKDVWAKLKDGIAVIALQKRPGSADAIGGTFTRQKARLYVTLENGTAKIEKCKNWAVQGLNPKGATCTYELIQGCRFNHTMWQKEDGATSA